MSKSPQNRNALGHVKEGLKNIPKVYKALYNAPKTDKPDAPGKGLVRTVKDNVKFVAKGSPHRIQTPTQKKETNTMRKNVVGMGIASVTPAGPIAAFAMGVKKSIAEKKSAKAPTPTVTKPVPTLKIKTPTTGKPKT